MAATKKDAIKGKKDAPAQSGVCVDQKCPIHGSVRLRGREFVGHVTSDKMTKTVVVGWTRRAFVKKFERYEVRKSKLNAHNSDCIGAKKGDLVKIVETRPLSKTKNFTVTEILGKATAKEFIKSETIETEDAREAVARKKDDKEKKGSDEE